jgi:hypothetical protein
MLLSRLGRGIAAWKTYFYPIKVKGKMSDEIFNEIINDVYKDMNRLKDQYELLAQDQYAKAHLGEVNRLDDRISSVLMSWDRTIDNILNRIDNIERHMGIKNE